MTQYQTTVTVHGHTPEELAEMLETAADRVRHQQYDFTGNGLDETASIPAPCVSGEGSDGGYGYVVTAASEDPNFFQSAGWTDEDQNSGGAR